MGSRGAINPENLLRCLQDLAASGMHKKTTEVTEGEIMASQKNIDRGTKRIAHQCGEFRTENNSESVSLDVPAHDVLGVWPTVLANCSDERATHPHPVDRTRISTEHNT